MRMFTAFAVAFLWSASAQAGTFEEGVDAFRDGRSAEALAIWTPLAEAGDSDAQFNVGIVLAHGPMEVRDRAEALKWLNRAAEQGDVIAAFNLGVMYADEDEVDHDYSRAADWYEVAVEHHHPGAMVDLSFLLANGRGRAQNLSRAASLTLMSEEAECLLGEQNDNFRPRLSRLLLTN